MLDAAAQSLTPASSVTRSLVDAVLAVRADDLPLESLDAAAAMVADGIATMLAGSAEPSGLGHKITDWVADIGGAPEASVVAGGFRTSALNAAFANGTMGHALDFDNFMVPPNHPTSPTLPAILALAEKYHRSGTDVLAAVVVAVEVQARLRIASMGLDTGKGFHKPGTTGTFGATAACGWLLGLDSDQLAVALGIAGSRAGSLSINTGTMTKSSHSGHAARMGVECAELARRGWTASMAVFDEGGYFDTFLGDRYDAELLTRDFGAPFYIIDPGMGFKKHPSNAFTQWPIDAALELRQRNSLRAADIAGVRVETFPFSYVDRPFPRTGLDGKFSIQYTTAVALLDGYVDVCSFSDERRFAPDMEQLLPKIEVHHDPSIPMNVLDSFIRMQISLRDGMQMAIEKRDVTGMPGHPLTREQRVKKFHACAEMVMPEDIAQRLLSRIERIAELDDIAELMAIVRAPDGRGAGINRQERS